MNVQTLRNKANLRSKQIRINLRLAGDLATLLTDITEDHLADGFLAQIHCLPCVLLNASGKENLLHYVKWSAPIAAEEAGACSCRRSIR